MLVNAFAFVLPTFLGDIYDATLIWQLFLTFTTRKRVTRFKLFELFSKVSPNSHELWNIVLKVRYYWALFHLTKLRLTLLSFRTFAFWPIQIFFLDFGIFDHFRPFPEKYIWKRCISHMLSSFLSFIVFGDLGEVRQPLKSRP